VLTEWIYQDVLILIDQVLFEWLSRILCPWSKLSIDLQIVFVHYTTLHLDEAAGVWADLAAEEGAAHAQRGRADTGG
jgi:hypothetical protein